MIGRRKDRSRLHHRAPTAAAAALRHLPPSPLPPIGPSTLCQPQLTGAGTGVKQITVHAAVQPLPRHEGSSLQSQRNEL